MRKLATFVPAMLLCGAAMLVPNPVLAGVDSFFDVFFDVEFNADTQGPSIRARGTLTTFSTGQREKIPVEIVALSLVSSDGPAGSTQHQATLRYNIGSSGLDGVRAEKGQNTAYAELDITCYPRDSRPRCETNSVRASDRNEFYGHVTVLK